MSRAEKFIEERTMNHSNEIIGGGWNNGEFVQIFNPWLTPDQARRAVEIARGEMIEKTVEWIENNFSLYEGISGYYVAKEFKQAMKDE